MVLALSGRGWLPDRTGIFLLSSHNTGPWGVKVQGRVDSVRAMAVLGAGYALGISPNVRGRYGRRGPSL